MNVCEQVDHKKHLLVVYVPEVLKTKNSKSLHYIINISGCMKLCCFLFGTNDGKCYSE